MIKSIQKMISKKLSLTNKYKSFQQLRALKKFLIKPQLNFFAFDFKSKLKKQASSAPEILRIVENSNLQKKELQIDLSLTNLSEIVNTITQERLKSNITITSLFNKIKATNAIFNNKIQKSEVDLLKMLNEWDFNYIMKFNSNSNTKEKAETDIKDNLTTISEFKLQKDKNIKEQIEASTKYITNGIQKSSLNNEVKDLLVPTNLEKVSNFLQAIITDKKLLVIYQHTLNLVYLSNENPNKTKDFLKSKILQLFKEENLDFNPLVSLSRINPKLLLTCFSFKELIELNTEFEKKINIYLEEQKAVLYLTKTFTFIFELLQLLEIKQNKNLLTNKNSNNSNSLSDLKDEFNQLVKLSFLCKSALNAHNSLSETCKNKFTKFYHTILSSFSLINNLDTEVLRNKITSLNSQQENSDNKNDLIEQIKAVPITLDIDNTDFTIETTDNGEVKFKLGKSTFSQLDEIEKRMSQKISNSNISSKYDFITTTILKEINSHIQFYLGQYAYQTESFEKCIACFKNLGQNYLNSLSSHSRRNVYVMLAESYKSGLNYRMSFDYAFDALLEIFDSKKDISKCSSVVQYFTENFFYEQIKYSSLYNKRERKSYSQIEFYLLTYLMRYSKEKQNVALAKSLYDKIEKINFLNPGQFMNSDELLRFYSFGGSLYLSLGLQKSALETLDFLKTLIGKDEDYHNLKYAVNMIISELSLSTPNEERLKLYLESIIELFFFRQRLDKDDKNSIELKLHSLQKIIGSDILRTLLAKHGVSNEDRDSHSNLKLNNKI